MPNTNEQSSMFRIAEALSSTSFVEASREFEEIWKTAAVRKRFGSNIIVVRGIRNMKINVLAKRCDFDYAHLSRIQTGKVNCTFKTVLTICQVLGVSLRTMLMKDLKEICETAIRAQEGEQA